MTLSLLWSSSFSLSLLWLFPPPLFHLSIMLEVWLLNCHRIVKASFNLTSAIFWKFWKYFGKVWNCAKCETMCLGWTKLFSLLCQLSSSLGCVDMLLVKKRCCRNIETHQQLPFAFYQIAGILVRSVLMQPFKEGVHHSEQMCLSSNAEHSMAKRVGPCKHEVSLRRSQISFFWCSPGCHKCPALIIFNQCHRFPPLAVALGTTRRVSMHAKAWCCKRFFSESMCTSLHVSTTFAMCFFLCSYGPILQSCLQTTCSKSTSWDVVGYRNKQDIWENMGKVQTCSTPACNSAFSRISRIFASCRISP